MSPRQHSMDDNPLSPDILPNRITVNCSMIPAPSDLVLRAGLLLDGNSEVSNSVILQVGLLLTWQFFILSFSMYYRQKPSIASRLRAVPDTCTREMDKVLFLMKQWERRSYEKVDDYRNDEDTTMRLRRFLDAIESPELTNKIYDLRRLSRRLNRRLNLVTERLIRSQVIAAMGLITQAFFRNLYLYVVPVSED